MISGLSRSAAACSAATLSTSRKALSVLRKPMLQLLLDEAVAIEVIAGPEREERRHPHDHRTENLIAYVEVVVCEAAALGRENAMIRVAYFGTLMRKVDPCSRL